MPEATEATVATQDDLIKLESSIMARLDAMLSQYFRVKDKPAEPPAVVLPTSAEQLALTNSAGTSVPNPVAFVKPSGVTT